MPLTLPSYLCVPELAQAGRGGRGTPLLSPGSTLEAQLQPCSARTGAQPATALLAPMALGARWRHLALTHLTADTRYLDAFKPKQGQASNRISLCSQAFVPANLGKDLERMKV